MKKAKTKKEKNEKPSTDNSKHFVSNERPEKTFPKRIPGMKDKFSDLMVVNLEWKD